MHMHFEENTMTDKALARVVLFQHRDVRSDQREETII